MAGQEHTSSTTEGSLVTHQTLVTYQPLTYQGFGVTLTALELEPVGHKATMCLYPSDHHTGIVSWASVCVTGVKNLTNITLLLPVFEPLAEALNAIPKQTGIHPLLGVVLLSRHRVELLH